MYYYSNRFSNIAVANIFIMEKEQFVTHHFEEGIYDYYEIHDPEKYIEYYEKVGWVHCREGFLDDDKARKYYLKQQLKDEDYVGSHRHKKYCRHNGVCIICKLNFCADDEMLHCRGCSEHMCSVCAGGLQDFVYKTRESWLYFCPYCYDNSGEKNWTYSRCSECEEDCYLYNSTKKICYDCYIKKQ